MFPLNPADFWRSALQASQIMVESQTVIALRLAGMAGFWPMGGAEAARMVQEKMDATVEASQAMLRAGMAGGDLNAMAAAAMKPIRKRTNANAKRLTAKASRAR
jgi:hypothetical protein